MASTDKYYWKIVGFGAPVALADGSHAPFEKLADDVGYAVVDKATNEELAGRLGTEGLAVGTKAEYDELKKKPLSTPSPPPWREEIRGEIASQSPITPSQADAQAELPAEDVAVAEPKTAVEKQAKAEVLPQETKPKAGKRKGKK